MLSLIFVLAFRSVDSEISARPVATALPRTEIGTQQHGLPPQEASAPSKSKVVDATELKIAIRSSFREGLDGHILRHATSD